MAGDVVVEVATTDVLAELAVMHVAVVTKAKTEGRIAPTPRIVVGPHAGVIVAVALVWIGVAVVIVGRRRFDGRLLCIALVGICVEIWLSVAGVTVGCWRVGGAG